MRNKKNDHRIVPLIKSSDIQQVDWLKMTVKALLDNNLHFETTLYPRLK